MNNRLCWIALLAILSGSGCVNVKPIKVEPIHITMDVNIRVDKELEEFFEFEEDMEPVPSATAIGETTN